MVTCNSYLFVSLYPTSPPSLS
uniref:Uncharacterized protein n=1 Tax=Rhizophora mucronata TaxID=61149 RepID=A0A2P2R548_RHIMU